MHDHRGMIDLHSHTTESDGTLTPPELVLAARQAGLEALGITDHDTFGGYDRALDSARELALDLVCGIELAVKFKQQSVHLLGYFLNGSPSEEFRNWVRGLQGSRHARNEAMVERLRSKGVEITLQELHQCGGNLPGRPHFARLLSEKGYVARPREAFERYIGEGASCFVEREEVGFAESVERIAASGGLSSLAHPLRTIPRSRNLEEYVRIMKSEGLDCLEVYHSDHRPEDVNFLSSLAASLSLGVTGGSDFHGATKPGIDLGKGRDGALNVPYSLLADLRRIPSRGTTR